MAFRPIAHICWMMTLSHAAGIESHVVHMYDNDANTHVLKNQ